MVKWTLIVCSTLPIVFALLLQTVDVRGFILRVADAFYSGALGAEEVGDVLLAEELRRVSPNLAYSRFFTNRASYIRWHGGIFSVKGGAGRAGVALGQYNVPGCQK